MIDVGLIGNGNFGRFIVHKLSRTCRFHTYDKTDSQSALFKALSQPYIILAIPAQYLGEFLQSNSAVLRDDSCYFDVCSVKVEPVKIMRELLPASAQIVATHPTFGPASAKTTLRGQKIMFFPVRASKTTELSVRSFLEGYELDIIEATPEDHDKQMAYVQGLSHYIGRIMQALDIPDVALSTAAYRDLLDMKRIQGNDSDDLFLSIIHNNPYAAEVLAKFKQAMAVVDTAYIV